MTGETPDIIGRENLEALAELGRQRLALRDQLEDIESRIDGVLARAYADGWTWEELSEASTLSRQPLARRLQKLGLTKQVSRSGPGAKVRKARERSSRINARAKRAKPVLETIERQEIEPQGD